LPYVARQDFAEAMWELASLIKPGAPHHHLQECCRSLLIQYPNQFRRVVLKSRTTGTPEGGMRLEPTEFMLRLIAAVRANSDYEISVISHELRSLSGVATTG